MSSALIELPLPGLAVGDRGSQPPARTPCPTGCATWPGPASYAAGNCPAAANVYELTEWGRGPEPIVIALGTWAPAAPPTPDRAFLSTDVVMLTLRTFTAPAPRRPEAALRIELTDHHPAGVFGAPRTAERREKGAGMSVPVGAGGAPGDRTQNPRIKRQLRPIQTVSIDVSPAQSMQVAAHLPVTAYQTVPTRPGASLPTAFPHSIRAQAVRRHRPGRPPLGR